MKSREHQAIEKLIVAMQWLMVELGEIVPCPIESGMICAIHEKFKEAKQLLNGGEVDDVKK